MQPATSSPRSFADLAADVLAAPPRLGGTRLVCVDGPAGSGKTTFGRRLARALDAPLVHMDDLYAGWTLAGAADRLATGVLDPVRAGRPGSCPRYDWAAGAFAAEPIPVPVTAALVVEGCGSSAPALDPLTTLRIWLEAPAELRLRRGLARDGQALAPEWLRWQHEEAAHFAAERTRDRADLVVDGTTGGDEYTELVGITAERPPVA